MHALTEDAKATLAVSPTDGAAGTTDINGAILDMAGFNAAAAVVVMGAITASAVTSIKWQEGDESDLSDAADLAGTGISIADDEDETIFITDLVRPTKRYCRLVVDRGTANAVVASAVYLQYAADERPVTQSSDVSDSEIHVSPVAGTA